MSSIVLTLPARSSDAKEREHGRRPARFRLPLWRVADRQPQAREPARPGRRRVDRVRCLLRGPADRRRPRERRHLQRARLPRPPGLRGLHAAPVRAEDRPLADLVGIVDRRRAARRAGRRPLRGRRRGALRVRRHHRRRALPRPLRLARDRHRHPPLGAVVLVRRPPDVGDELGDGVDADREPGRRAVAALAPA